MSTYFGYTLFRFWPGRVWLRLGLTLSGALALFGILFLVLAGPVYAATITVNTTADDDIVNGNCTLREAIRAANTNTAVDGCMAGGDGPDTIVFGSMADGTITLLSALPTISQTLIIDGVGRSVTVSGNDTVRVFNVTAPLTLQAITITRGSAYDGGGINATAVLTLTQVNVLSNTARNMGGGVFAGAVTINDSVFQNNQVLTGTAGGLFASNILTMTNTNFLSNTAQDSGGGVLAGGMATINGGVFQNNRANTGDGGGLLGNGHITITGAQFIANTAANGGGGFSQSATTGDVRVTNALFARNTADNGIGAAVRFSSNALTILHTTIASPTLATGSALFIFNGTVAITNTLIASYAVGLERDTASMSGVVSEDFNLFFGNTNDITGTVTSGGHSMSGFDPRFANPIGDDYRLTDGSGAFDRGTNVGVIIDFEGDLRPQGDGFDIGYDELPFTRQVQFSAGTFSVSEDAGPALITVTLNAPSPLTTTVTVTSANGTATAGMDYTAISQTLTIVPGAAQVTFTVGISDDLVSEAAETMLLILGSPTNATLAGINPATLIIVDDESAIYLPTICKQ